MKKVARVGVQDFRRVVTVCYFSSLLAMCLELNTSREDHSSSGCPPVVRCMSQIFPESYFMYRFIQLWILSKINM